MHQRRWAKKMDDLLDVAFRYGWSIVQPDGRLLNENDVSYHWPVLKWTETYYGDQRVLVPDYLRRRLRDLNPRDGFAVAREIADNFTSGSTHERAHRHIDEAERMFKADQV